MMTHRTKLAIAAAIFLWASAYAGIRAGLRGYSPEGLALFRYLIASLCMAIIYFRMPKRSSIKFFDMLGLLGVGALGIGVYNITLNYGELSVSSGMASFIISQAPIVTAILAIIFLGERMHINRLFGFMISVVGIALIAYGEKGGFKWDASLTYIVIAALSGGMYSVLQKPYLKKYHAIEATTFIIWGATIFLLMYAPHLRHDITQASWQATLTVIYLGVFPATIAYIAWSYVLAEIPASQAVSFIYFTPFVATLMGWIFLGEMPVLMSLAGGVCAVAGVWLVNKSPRYSKS